jgi:hypothetical protein
MTMKLCIIGKYPPIQGGVSRENFWQTYALAQAGFDVHYTPGTRHEYIPWANPFVTKLASIATDVIKAYGCELIYSFYLEPYAVAAHLASRWTGVPYGIRHAGSDMGPEARQAGERRQGSV